MCRVSLGPRPRPDRSDSELRRLPSADARPLASHPTLLSGFSRIVFLRIFCIFFLRQLFRNCRLSGAGAEEHRLSRRQAGQPSARTGGGRPFICGTARSARRESGRAAGRHLRPPACPTASRRPCGAGQARRAGALGSRPARRPAARSAPVDARGPARCESFRSNFWLLGIHGVDFMTAEFDIQERRLQTNTALLGALNSAVWTLEPAKRDPSSPGAPLHGDPQPGLADGQLRAA